MRHETGVDLGEANVLITESIKRNEYDEMRQVVVLKKKKIEARPKEFP